MEYVRAFFSHPEMRTLVQFAQFGSGVWCLQHYLFTLSLTSGPSMLPTLRESGDIVFVDRTVRGMDVGRGDVVNFASTYRANFHVCKRVVGLEGDVLVRKGWVGPLTVPPGHVWLEGDNPDNSTDSRHYGPVPLALLRGRVGGRVWPPWLWGGLGVGPSRSATRVFRPGQEEEARWVVEEEALLQLQDSLGGEGGLGDAEAVLEVRGEREALRLLGARQSKEEYEGRVRQCLLSFFTRR